MNQQTRKIMNEPQVEVATALSVADQFTPFERLANEWMEKAKAIKVTDASQVETIKAAREARLAIKSIRGKIEALRVELKEEHLRKGNEVQQIANRLKAMIEPIEEVLQEQEDFVKIQAEREKKHLLDARVEQLKPYMGLEALNLPLADMSQDVFDNMVVGMKHAKEAKEQQQRDQAAAEEQQRVARVAEDKRIREENAVLKDREKRMTDRINQLISKGLTFDFAENAYTLKSKDVFVYVPALDITDERPEKWEKVMESVQKGYDILQQEIKTQQAEDLKQKTLHEARLKKETDARKKLEAEARERAEKEDRERKEKAAADRKFKRAPDKTKLLSFSVELDNLRARLLDLNLNDQEANCIQTNTVELISKTIKYITSNAETL